VEQGTHAELYAKAQGAYHALVQLQEQAMDKMATAGSAVVCLASTRHIERFSQGACHTCMLDTHACAWHLRAR
jgi:hypothetical protein